MSWADRVKTGRPAAPAWPALAPSSPGAGVPAHAGHGSSQPAINPARREHPKPVISELNQLILLNEYQAQQTLTLCRREKFKNRSVRQARRRRHRQPQRRRPPCFGRLSDLLISKRIDIVFPGGMPWGWSRLTLSRTMGRISTPRCLIVAMPSPSTKIELLSPLGHIRAPRGRTLVKSRPSFETDSLQLRPARASHASLQQLLLPTWHQLCTVFPHPSDPSSS